MQTIGLCKESPRSEENNIQRTRKGQAVESEKDLDSGLPLSA